MAMSISPSPKPASGTASPAPEADGFLLLTIQHSVIKQIYDGDTMVLARGELRLECVSLPIPPEIGKQTANPFSPSPSDPKVPTHDFWLILRVGPTFEMPLIPSSEISPLQSNPEGIAYLVASPNVKNAKIEVILPKPSSGADMEDLESFEVLLKQYGNLLGEATALAGLDVPILNGTGVGGVRYGEEVRADESMRGKLVLINEETGQVVGELDQELDLDEDKAVAGDDTRKPVMLDFGNVIDGYAPKVKVQTVPADELDDWMLKGAHTLSKGILSFGSWSSKMMQSGATAFINNTTPRAEPVKFSPTTKAGIRKAHNASVRTVNVTKTTTGMINNAISKVVETTYEKGISPAVDAVQTARRNSNTAYSNPPLPPRRGSVPYSSTSPRPDLPARLQATTLNTPASAPPLPNRTPSPFKAQTIQIPGQAETLLAQTEHLDQKAPLYSEPSPISQNSSRTTTPTTASQSQNRTKRPFLNRVLLAGEVVLTSLEATAHDLINNGTAAASSAAGHKYGPEAGHATALLGGSVRNVAVVYIDVRGVGRRALLKSSAKGFVKARLKNGEVVRLQGDEHGDGGVGVGEVEREGGEVVVGMSEVGRSSAVQSGRSEKDGLKKRA